MNINKIVKNKIIPYKASSLNSVVWGGQEHILIWAEDKIGNTPSKFISHIGAVFLQNEAFAGLF
jgi:hypothetical protein